jgi:hypothetical protein
MKNSIKNSGIVYLGLLLVFLPVAGLCVDLPYQTGFEPPTFTAGSLDAQDGWSVTEGTATVQTTKKYEGTQAVEMAAESTAQRALDGSGISVVWAQGYYSGDGISGTPEVPASPPATAIVFFSADNGIQCYDGDGTGSGSFVNTGVSLSSSVWRKISVKFDFSSQTWECYIDDALEASAMGFKDNVAQFNGFMNFSKVQSYLDNFMVMPSLKGDATLDGAVDIVDVVVTVNHLQGAPTQTDPIVLDNMDVTNDGNIMSDDVTGIVDIILGK